MPFSSDFVKTAIFEHIRTVTYNFLPKEYTILDVGAGSGTYGKCLSDLNIHALETHYPYIEKYNLSKYYKKVFCENILLFNYDNYDYIILGDVLEHIKTEDAQALIKDITKKNIKCIVAVPFLSKQEAIEDVQSEFHHQSDLTLRVMKSRYPELELFLTNNLEDGYGYYTNYITWKK